MAFLRVSFLLLLLLILLLCIILLQKKQNVVFVLPSCVSPLSAGSFDQSCWRRKRSRFTINFLSFRESRWYVPERVVID